MTDVGELMELLKDLPKMPISGKYFIFNPVLFADKDYRNAPLVIDKLTPRLNSNRKKILCYYRRFVPNYYDTSVATSYSQVRNYFIVFLYVRCGNFFDVKENNEENGFEGPRMMSASCFLLKPGKGFRKQDMRDEKFLKALHVDIATRRMLNE